MRKVGRVKESPSPGNVGEVNFSQAGGSRLETTQARFSRVLKRHGELTERLSRDSNKTISERLHREFEAACASRTQEICLDGEQWNDGLLATIRERVHVEAERKALQLREPAAIQNLPFYENTTYRVGNKMICCFERARIGIQYETSFAGEPRELFYCILESKSFLDKITILEHTVPFFLPIWEVEKDFLSLNATKFIDLLEDLLQAYVDRREQVLLIKELYGDQIGELHFSLPYNMIEFVFGDFDCKVTVNLKYADFHSTLPSEVSVLAWPIQQSKNSGTGENEDIEIQPIPVRLLYAEEALLSMSLPEAFAEIVLKLPQPMKEMFGEEDYA